MRNFLQSARRLGFPIRAAVIVFLLHLSSTLFESIGLGMLLPVFQYVQSGGDLAGLTKDSGLWRGIVEVYGSVGLEVNLIVLSATSFVSILVRQVFIYVRLVYTARASQNLIRTVVSDGFKRFIYADARYQGRQSTGIILNDLSAELQRAVSAIFGTVLLGGYFVMLFVYGTLMVMLSATMTIAALIVMLCCVFLLRSLWQRSRKTGDEVTNANQGMTAFLAERLQAVRLIRLSGTETAEIDAMDRLTLRRRDKVVALYRLSATLEVMIEPLVVLMGFIILYAGTTLFALDLETISIFLVVLLRLLPIIKMIMKLRQSILGTMAGLEAVESRLERMANSAEAQGGKLEFNSLEHGIKFRGVTFHYADGNDLPALDDMTCSIPAGKFMALAGPSGAGKSTFVDMLPRLHQPDKGVIEFDGVPIQDFSLSSLRAGIAYAPQTPQIFNITPAEHIRYGRPNATFEEIRRAARLAGADSFIQAMPDGYDTALGEKGLRLSGGEKQRLDLSRALVSGGHILILDEPTSHLDAHAEDLFREALKRIRAETQLTIIVIAHRLSTIVNADRIAVLEAGSVTAVGTHDELVRQRGWYAEAYAIQQRPKAKRSGRRSAADKARRRLASQRIADST